MLIKKIYFPVKPEDIELPREWVEIHSDLDGGIKMQQKQFSDEDDAASMSRGCGPNEFLLEEIVLEKEMIGEVIAVLLYRELVKE